MTETTMRTWVEIDTKALIHNLQYAKQLTGKKVMAVIKGNAHGHGAAIAGLAMEAEGCDAFGVACLNEGIELRQHGVKAPILVLGWTPAEFASKLAGFDLTQSILDEDYAIELSAAAKDAGVTVDIHAKLDTGMTRTGIFAQTDPAAAAAAVYRISGLPHLNMTGIFTHFAAADMPEKNDFTAWQLSNYKAVLAELDRLGFDKEVVHHTGNSACIMAHPETYFDMVRMGVMMYGFYPDGIFREDGPLEQVLSLKSRVVQVKEVPAGSHVSYGCTFEAKRPTRIAVVGAGYADAYPRGLSNRGAYAVINGQKCPQIGRVCMDLCVFDATDADVCRGDEVILYGKGGMPLEYVAEMEGSINCEPPCLITNRVQRIYL